MPRCFLSLLLTATALLAPQLLAQEGQPHEIPNLNHLPAGLYAIFDTYMGIIVAELYEKQTPNTTLNFVGLATGRRAWRDPKTKKMVNRPMYNGITFHRVISQFMIQTGDPTGIGNHECGFRIPDEIVEGLIFDRPGRLAMATLEQPNTASCQFFITDAPAPRLDGKFSIFGQVVEGQDVVARLARVVTDSKDKPMVKMDLYNVTVVRLTNPRPGATK